MNFAARFLLVFYLLLAPLSFAAGSRNVFNNMSLKTAYSELIKEKNSEKDSLLPAFNADRAFAEVIRQDKDFWSLGRLNEKKESIVTKLNVEAVFIDGVREDPFCELDKSVQNHAGEWNVRIGVDFVSGGSNTVHAHVQQCLDEIRDEIGYAVKEGNNIVFVPPRKYIIAPKEELVETFDTLQTAEVIESLDTVVANEPILKKFWGGAVIGLTYNDFYATKFGLAKPKSAGYYSIRTDGTDDLLGNYWGLGFNVLVGGLYYVSPRWVVNADVGFAYRHGSGDSRITVTLDWDDESRPDEKSDLDIDYDERQLNVDIPVALRYLLYDMFYAEAGPLMSFNLYSRNKSVVSDIYGRTTFRESGGMNMFEFGLIFGTGTLRRVGKGMLDLNLRFMLGLTPLCDADDAPRTWQWQLNVGYWFI